MPENNQRDNSPKPSEVIRRRRFINQRNTIIVAIGLTCAVIALVLVGLLAFRLGYVDNYIAGQVKDTLSKYGVRAEIKNFHTTWPPQTVEMLGVELYDAKTGEKLGKIDRMLAKIRVADLYALNLRRNINLEDLQIEGLELWVNFDAQGNSNFRNIHVPPPEPNARILFAYSTAHIDVKNSQIHYGDQLHSLSGEARNLRATIQPDDPNAPAASRMNVVTFTSTNSTFVYDGKPVNNIDIDARARINQTRAEIQDLTLRSPLAEAHLQGVMDDWRALKYNLNITSSVDLTQASDILQSGMALRGAGNFVGTVVGDGDHYQVDGSIKSDAIAADNLRLQGLHVSAKGSGQRSSYEFNGRAVAQLLTAGDFQLNVVQITGGVMGTGTNFRWIGELRAAAEKSYGTTITGLILRDARAEYNDGVITASAPQFNGSSLTTKTAKVQNGIQANDLRVRIENGKTTANIASAKAGKIQSGETTINGVTAKTIDIKSEGDTANVTVKEVQVGEANAFGAQTGSLNIAGVRLAVHNGRVQGSTSDINAGTVKLKDGSIENVKLVRPAFTLEPSGRYRASADLSLGGGVLGQMKLGPAHASVVATSDQIQLTSFVAEALDGRATGSATISLRKNGLSKVNASFDNFDLGGLITLKSGRAVPISSKVTGTADLSFSGTDFANANGSVNAKLTGAASPGSDLAPLSGEIAVTANQGQFQIQRASLQTPATTLTASGQFSIEQPTSNLRIDLASTDASELQRLFISSGAIPELYEQFRTLNLDLGGRLTFNGTLNGALKDPIVNGHAELASLLVNKSDVGSLSANIASTGAETRITDGRLVQAGGGSAQFSLVMPRIGKDNISIDAKLDRFGGPITLPFKTGFGDEITIDAPISGQIQIAGLTKNMSGVADVRLGAGNIGGEPLQGGSARATFSGTTVNIEKSDLNFDAGHLVASGKFDTSTQAFELQASGDRIQLARLGTLISSPRMPKLEGTATVTSLKASGVLNLEVKDFSGFQIDFNAESNNATLDGQSAGALTLVGQTQNKQLNVTVTSTGLLGDTPQLVTARVNLADEKLPATIESTITDADLTQLFRILMANARAFEPSSTQPEITVTGRASGQLKLSGNLMTENDQGEEVLSWHGLTGTATVSNLSINIPDFALTADGPMVVELRSSELVFHETHLTGNQTNVTLGGSIATSPGGRNTLAINGRVNLRILNLQSPDIISSGVAVLNVMVGGTYENTRVTGRASVSGASVSIYLGDQRVALSNLNGAILFNAKQMQIEKATGTIGGGQISATGGAQLSGLSISQFLLNVRGDKITLDYPADFRSTVNLNLELRGSLETQGRQFIRGNVEVIRTEYTKDINLAELINQRGPGSIEEGSEFKFAETANFDKLRVEGRNALIMRNNLGNLVGSISLQLDGPVKSPVVEGRITATRGTLNFRNNPYEITRGLIYLPARYGADPVLNIEAQSVIRGYRVTAIIEGPLTHPTTTVAAEPSLPQADVVSLILTGTLASTDTNASVLAQSGLGTAASLLTDALINAPISRASNKLFGLSRLEINPVIGSNNSAPTARLTAARQLTKDMTVTYSTNIASDPNQILTVEYRVSNRMSFVAQYEQGSNRNLSTRNNNYSFEIRFRKRF
jgi:translocation and assembly module TamB